MTPGPHDGIDVSGAERPRFRRTSDGGRELREQTLDTLRRADGPLPLTEVAGHIVAPNDERDPGVTSREEIQRVYLSLVRYQIPRLEQRGVVEYSEEDGTIRLVGPGTP